MVAIPGHARRGRDGKLTAVLDHTLRIGDAEVSDKIIAAYKERGIEPPEHVEAPPTIEPRFLCWWEAYQDLQTERRAARGPIPIGAITSYAREYGLDADTLKRIVWAVDRVLLDHWRGIDEAEKARHGRTGGANGANSAVSEGKA